MNPTGSESEDPLSPLMTGATALHENMMSLISAGFTREEALRIIMTMLTEAIRASNGGGGGGG